MASIAMIATKHRDAIGIISGSSSRLNRHASNGELRADHLIISVEINQQVPVARLPHKPPAFEQPALSPGLREAYISGWLLVAILAHSYLHDEGLRQRPPPACYPMVSRTLPQCQDFAGEAWNGTYGTLAACSLISVACLAFLAAALVVLGVAVITVAKVPNPRPNNLGLMVAWTILVGYITIAFTLALLER
jgi:hypothetical protein